MALFKDFVNGLGATIKDSAMLGIVQGLKMSEMRNNTATVDRNTDYLYNEDYIYSPELSHSSNEDILTTYKMGHYDIANGEELDDSSSKFGNENIVEKDKYMYYPKNHLAYGSTYTLNMPQWGYEEFVNERNIFLKCLSNGLDGPNWSYFKIFFDFDTMHGLFGGILNMYGKKGIKDEDDSTSIEQTHAMHASINGAYKYLYQCKERYKMNNIGDRMVSLVKFTRLLSFINVRAPWFFKSIKNANALAAVNYTKPADDKYIELEFAQDAIDMRITTLLSLYKYACYDDIECKEIIPENLRKFNMFILIFSAPLKYIHTPLVGNDGNILQSDYKALPDREMNANNNSYMSFKLFKLMNCEIDIDSINGYIPADMTNESPFALGANTIKIRFDKVYEYVMNEFTGLMLGSDGIYLNNYNIQVNTVGNLTTATEQFINRHIDTLLGNDTNYALGNLWGQEFKMYKSYTDKTRTIGKAYTDYARRKMDIMANTRSTYLLNTGYDMLYKWLGSSYTTGKASGIDGSGKILTPYNGKQYVKSNIVRNAKDLSPEYDYNVLLGGANVRTP